MTEERRPRPSPIDRMYLAIDGVMEVLLIRHGEQERDMQTASDFRDPPLSERGRQQAKALGESLAGVHLDAVFASNLQRAHDTALALTGHHDLEPQIIGDLREHEVFRDLPDDPPLYKRIPRGPLRAACPGAVAFRPAACPSDSVSSCESFARNPAYTDQLVPTRFGLAQ